MGVSNFYRRRIKGQTMCFIGNCHMAYFHPHYDGRCLRYSVFTRPSELRPECPPNRPQFTLLTTWQIWKLKFTPDYQTMFLNILLKAPNSLDLIFFGRIFALRVWTWQRFHPLQRAIWCLRFKNHLNNQPFLRPNLDTKPSSLYPDSLKGESSSREVVRGTSRLSEADIREW